MKVWYERRDELGYVVERVGPFERNSEPARRALQHQVAIAEAHNRVRPPGSSGGGGRQLVYEAEQ